ncbi:hypothetical protein [Vampirovibrio sp.]|uniref:hypothetical protein n=1 Tax=Vampirovibrio sp. TaxID=2717857 RepID=UPI0035931546
MEAWLLIFSLKHSVLLYFTGKMRNVPIGKLETLNILSIRGLSQQHLMLVNQPPSLIVDPAYSIALFRLMVRVERHLVQSLPRKKSGGADFSLRLNGADF